MNLKERRLALGFSLAELCRRCGIHPVTLSRIENGAIKLENITLKNAVRLADALGCEPRDLIKEEEQ